MRRKVDRLKAVDNEEAVVLIMRLCGENNNPIGFFRDSLATLGVKASYRNLYKAGLIKVTNQRGSIGWYSSWIQLSTKGKNLYRKVGIKYRWNY